MALLLEPLDGAIVDPPDGVELDPTRVVRIGRAGSSELKVHDQHVEVHHARLYFDESRDQWIIEDLKSGHGTFLNGECLRGTARVVKPGAELRFGDARIRMVNTMRLPWWALLPGMLAGLLVVLAILLLIWAWSRPSSDHVIQLDRDGVLTPAGRVQQLPADAEFLRERGLSWNLKKNRQVTDGNEDGIDELWLDVNGEKELIITFDEHNRWVEIGLMPPGGVVNRGYGYPEVDIRGERWRMDPQIGRYRPFEHDAPVVWYRSEKAAVKEGEPAPHTPGEPTELPGVKPIGPLKVTRLSLRDEDLLGQFLSERGVHVPVHYIICEGAFEGIRAQVLTYEGEVLPLLTGCIGELHMEDNDEKKKENSDRPFAIALTPAGWRALVDDVVTFYTGSPEGLFLEPRTEKIVNQVRKDPGFLKTGRLFARPSNPVPGPNPLPHPGAEASGIHPLTATELHSAAPRAQTMTLTTPHQAYEVDLDGSPTGDCEKLRITLAEFEPGTFGISGDFAIIEEVGCGAPRPVLTVGYNPGIHAAPVGKYKIRFQVEADTLGKVTRVRRARLSWR